MRFVRWCASLGFGAVVWLNAGTGLKSAESLCYLPSGWPVAGELLTPPPAIGSAEQMSDMSAVLSAFHSATSNQIALAYSEKNFSISNFTAAVDNVLRPGRFPKLESFVARVEADAEIVTAREKDFWKRSRPYTVDTNLANGKLETSYSYPSGHSTEAMTMALVLAELFPDKRDDLIAVGRDIGWHRVLIARHYPTDIYAGRVLAQGIVREMKKDQDFQKDFAEAKKEIEAAQFTPRVEPIRQQPAAN